MSEHHVIERTESSSGITTGVILGLMVALLVAVVALFFVFGGPGRFTSSAPSQTNVNVPAQQQPSQQQPSGPNIQIPRQIDVNINQPVPQAPAQPPAGGS